LLAIYSSYIFLAIALSILQINFIKKRKNQKEFLLSKSEFIKAGEYQEKKEKLAIIERVLDFIMFIFWISFGFSFLDSLIQSDNSILKSVIFLNSFFILGSIISMPLDIYQKFKLDKEFGFSTIDTKTYIVDTIKSFVMLILVSSLLVALISYVIENFALWWLYGFLIIFAFMILINAIYPTIIAPMFNKFKPLENEELKNSISSLLKSIGFESSGIFVVDASKRDNRLNAYFGGLGKNKRVVLFDTLIEKLTQNELLAVLGHELGHFKHRDIFKNIAIMGVILFGVFFMFGKMQNTLLASVNLESNTHFLIALFLLTFSSITFFLLPLINIISRNNEYSADEFGSELKSREDLANALVKLATENKSFPFSHNSYIFFYYSHPPLSERLKRLGYKFN